MKTLAMRLVLRLMSLMPLGLAHGFGSFLGSLLLLVPNESRRAASTNLERCFPELRPPERRRLLRATLREAGKTFTELGALWYWPRTRTLGLVRGVSGLDALDRSMAKGAGVILLTPHLGAWEMYGLFMGARYPLTSLYRPPKLRAAEQLIRTARERSGARLVPTDAAGVRALYRALEQGEAVGLLPDQDPGKRGSTFAPFFGHAARTMVLASRLQAKTRAPIFVGYAERLPRGAGFHVHVIPVTAPEANPDRDIAVAGVNQAVEDCVRRVPAQYQWIYKRFKARPAGERPWY